MEKTISVIENFITYLTNLDIKSAEVEFEGIKIKIKKQNNFSATKAVSSNLNSKTETEVNQGKQIQNSPKLTVIDSLPSIKKTLEPEVKQNKFHTIKSPLVGTFFIKPLPDSPDYVQIGDNLTKGKIVCTIESMNLFNEIESDCEGKVLKILVKNGVAVEYDQPLFLIQP